MVQLILLPPVSKNCKVLTVVVLSAPTTKAPFPNVARAEKRFVELAVVAKKFVVVAFVPVALEKVRFWRVEELVTKSCPPIFEKLVFGSK